MSHESKSNVPLLDSLSAQPVNDLGATRPESDADKGQPGESKLPLWVVLHVPHDSTCIPSSVREQFLQNDAELNAELLCMTDHWTFDLFGHGVPAHQIIRAAVSRLVVDVERFDDDSQEVMAVRGMGAIYERSAHGLALRRLLRPEERESLLNTWYWPHHKRLELAVEKALAAHGHALVVDAHSFPSCPLPYELDQRPDRPDICIGTDSFHTPQGLEEAFVTAFRRAGFSVSVNFPFSGALVPKRHYGQDKRVASVMIEVNRGLYMDEISGRRLDHFTSVASALHRCIDHAISMVQR
jgi:N-formylglutamate deformylase